MKEKQYINIESLVERVNTNKTGIFNRDPELIATLSDNISLVIGDEKIYISEFIIAKIKGFIRNNEGHPEIDDSIFLNLPHSLSYPFEIYEDKRVVGKCKYIFIKLDPAHQIIVEILRAESGKTEINTIIPLNNKKRKQLKKNLRAVFTSVGGATNPSSSFSQQDRLSGVNTNSGETPNSRMHASQ